jgi:hypothetical protein
VCGDQSPRGTARARLRHAPTTCPLSGNSRK